MLGLGLGATNLSYVPSGSSFSNSKSLLFREGQEDFVTSNYTTSTVWQGTHSISCWVKPRDGRPESNQTFWGVTDGGADAFAFILSATGTLAYSIYSNGDLMVFGSATSRFDDGAQSDFTHYVAVVTKVSGGNSTFAVYENGSAITMNQLAPGSLELSETNHNLFGAGVGDTAAFALGAKLAERVQSVFYEGHIDEVTVWNTGLSEDAASEIYNGGDPTDLTSDGTHYSASNVVLYYRFEDDATDTAGTSDATITGATFSATVPSS